MSFLGPKTGLEAGLCGLFALALGSASCSGSKLVGRDLDGGLGSSAVGGQSSSAATGGAVAEQGGGSSVSSGGSAPVATATGGANAAAGGSSAAGAATGGAMVATGGANLATGGSSPVLASTSGAANATGGAANSTGGAANSTGGAANSTGGTSNVGGSAPDDCKQLNCLASHRFVYQANRRWQHTTTSEPDPIPESEYAPVSGEPLYLVSFSVNGAFASLAEVVSTRYPDPAGTSGKAVSTSIYYDFEDAWTGERLIVNQGASGLEGDLTFWGSGVPIIDATRGPLQITHDYDNHGDQCGLPLGVIPDSIPKTYDEAVAAGPGCGKRCAGPRNGYCNGTCAGYLVWEDRCWGVPVTVAYDPVTRSLVGYAWGDESAAICRGKFPPHAADGSKGWDMSKLDVNLTCD